MICSKKLNVVKKIIDDEKLVWIFSIISHNQLDQHVIPVIIWYHYTIFDWHCCTNLIHYTILKLEVCDQKLELNENYEYVLLILLYIKSSYLKRT